MTEKVLCYGTVWIAPALADEAASVDVRPPPGASHMTSPGLDSSYLTGLFLHASGKTLPDVVNELLICEGKQRSNEPLLRHVGGSPHTSPITYHLYDYGERFCQGVSALTEKRIQEIAANWTVIHQEGMPQLDATDLPSHRSDVLTQIVKLARTALTQGSRLRLRVDYRARPMQS